LLSIRSRRVKSTAFSGMNATPVPFRSGQNPLAAYRLRQAPTSIARLHCWMSFVVERARRNFPQLSLLSAPSLCPLRVPFVDVGLTTPLSIALAGVARPRAGYARNPFPSGRESTPWLPTILRQVPTAAPPLRGAFRLSADDFPRGDTRFPSPGFHLAGLRAT